MLVGYRPATAKPKPSGYHPLVPEPKPLKNAFAQACLDRLNSATPTTGRAMFGGHGFYSGPNMYALIYLDELYFRADASNVADFEDLGAKQFIYLGGKKPVQMPYWCLPETRLDRDGEFSRIVESAIAAANRAAALKKPKKPGTLR